MNRDEKILLACEYANDIHNHIGTIMPNNNDLTKSMNVLKSKEKILSSMDKVNELSVKYKLDLPVADDMKSIIDTCMSLANATRHISEHDDHKFVVDILVGSRDIIIAYDDLKYTRDYIRSPYNLLCVIL